MASDLIPQLKDRLDLVKMVQAVRTAELGELKRAGRGNFKGRCPFHDEKSGSFYVFGEIGAFKCYGCGKKGDVLTWLAWEHCKTFKPTDEQFTELLQEGCKRSGLNWDDYRAKDPRALDRAKRGRKREGILQMYAEVAQRAFTREALADVQIIKPWLSEEIQARWGLGFAPTLSQLHDGGISDEMLRLVGLLRESTTGAGETERPQREYLHFRNSIIIPFFHQERVVYLADRALPEHLANGDVRQRTPKTLSMPRPEENGIGGVDMPDGFNLEALYGRWPGRPDDDPAANDCAFVEGPLDAIAMCERGHGAVAMITSSPSPGLIKRVRRVNG